MIWFTRSLVDRLNQNSFIQEPHARRDGGQHTAAAGLYLAPAQLPQRYLVPLSKMLLRHFACQEGRFE